jgi:hypothetical protein
VKNQNSHGGAVMLVVIEVLSISQPQIGRPHLFSTTAQNDEHLRQEFLSDKP